jgi:L-threonylcarbamoyladenylate synthase
VRRVPIADLNASPKKIAEVKGLLAGGGIAAIPTETSYGLAADPRSPEGVRRVFEAKGREERKPLPVAFATREQLEGLGTVASEDVLARYFDIWPAPLTVILPLENPIAASCDCRDLAVRIPAYPELVLLLEAIGAVTATSANRSGEEPANDPDEVVRIFEGTVDLLVDGGPTPGGRPSTLLDATRDPPAVLRPGAFPWPVPGARL